MSHADIVQHGELYPIVDRVPYKVIQNLIRPEDRVGRDASLISLRVRSRLRARWTGLVRPPRKGEWYLSGALVEAYHAPNDLTATYPIAELVEVEPVPQTIRVVRVVPCTSEG